MVIFITSNSAFLEMKDLISSGEHSVWIAKNTLSESDLNFIYELDIEYTLLDSEVNTHDTDELQCALSSIKEHHYNEHIWVQF